jgi:predicted transcriptional regulator
MLHGTIEGVVMSASEKMDVIDLIISVLREHEGSLDSLVKRLEKIHLDLEESYNESSFKRTGFAGSNGRLLEQNVEELEKKLERYNRLLRELLSHCESINDIVCLRTIAKEALEQ